MTDAAAGSEEPGDHRQGQDRRRGDRRQSPRLPAFDESWLGATSVGASTAAPDSRRSETTLFGAPWAGAGEEHEQRTLSREARRAASAPGGALVRVVRTYAAARAAVGIALVAAQGATSLLGVRALPAVVFVCVLYAVQAVVLWLLPSWREFSEPQVLVPRRKRQWLATIGVDLVAFGMLHVLDAGTSFNYAALLVLPVLMSGVLMSRLLALATSAAVALLLLAVAWRAMPGGEGAAVVAQSGLAGIGLFAIALLAGELAGRLAREELAARGSLEIARQQARLNRLVIEEMADGVLVVDRRLRVRAANPAARTLLVPAGMAPAAPTQLREQPSSAPLGDAVERALAEGNWPESGRDIQIAFEDGSSRTLRLRVRFTRRHVDDARGKPADEEFCVLLLEDVRTAQARVRQEKLAAMGRMSAGIAHEIRNPLAAVAQANALMLEDELSAGQATLARMISDNVRRLQRIVDDVLEVAPGPAGDARTIDARAEVADIVREWARINQLADGPDSPVRTDLPAAALSVVFDPEHLRRVLINLLDNGLRHGTREAGAMVLRLAVRDESTAVLSVASDGPPIAPDIERHLFEPFFSTRSRGSGLGLYICRELCERYGATIEYRLRAASDRHRNGFVVVMQRGAFAAALRTHAT
jgi:two-component system, NtrC family, sensor histidine kinase PilS